MKPLSEPRFAPIVSETRPDVQPKGNSVQQVMLIKNQLSITTWLALGALAQITLSFLPIRPLYAYGPAITFLGVRLIYNFLMIFGVTSNVYLDGTLNYKVAAVYPPIGEVLSDTTEKGDSNTQQDTIALILLSAKFNHPLRMFAPGVKELGEWAERLNEDLHNRSDTYGYLGKKSWMATDERSTSPELMTVYYFRKIEDIHRFAHDELHRDAWSWWDKHLKKHPHIGIAHEVYESPAGSWENIYAQYQPSGFGLSLVPETQADGTKLWHRTIVDANRGRMATHSGRRGVEKQSYEFQH